MSYPSFHTYIKTLQALVKRKKPDLAEESMVLSNLCVLYGQRAGIPERSIKILLLAAHFKNLGAITISDQIFSQSFDSYGQLMACVVNWFDESTKLAEMAGLPQVALILGQYYQRTIPQDPLAKVFQVLNAWVACHQKRGWRGAMNDREALIVLQQRAMLGWSDPQVVDRFIQVLPTTSVTSQERLGMVLLKTSQGRDSTASHARSVVKV